MENGCENTCWMAAELTDRMDESVERVQRWLTDCVPHLSVRLTAVRNLRNGVEREVWDCSCRTKAGGLDAILTLFKPGSLETVNTNLPPELVSEKCFLAMSELPALGIPTPMVLGYAVSRGEAALLCERVATSEWISGTRVAAVRILARLHNLHEFHLSRRLQELVSLSDPLEYRTTGGRAPRGRDKRLVHGDYFSKNILLVAGDLCVIDWETFGWGDPMWDLGFLIGADHDLTDEEVEAVIAEYGSRAAIDRHRLMWHKRRWSDFWKARQDKSSEETCADHAVQRA